MSPGPLVVLARLSGERRWHVRVGDGSVDLAGLGLDVGKASVVFDASRATVRLKMNERFVRSRQTRDVTKALTQPFTVTTSAGSLEVVCFCADDSTHRAAPTPTIMKAIEAVRANDDATTRSVLGDVLEDAGAVAEAEYVRVEVELQQTDPSAPDFTERVRRLKALSSVVGPTFRYLVGRDIDGCSGVRWAFRCPKPWDEMAPTNDDSERICGTCRQLVVQVEHESAARTLASEGVCVSVQERWVGEMAAEPEGGHRQAMWVGSVAARPYPIPPTPPPPQPVKVQPTKPWWKRLLGG